MFVSKFRQFRPIFYASKSYFHSKPANLLYVSMRCIHARGYNRIKGDFRDEDAKHMLGYTLGSESCEDVAYTFEKFPELSHDLIAKCFHLVSKYM